jgi:hypothetical protein
MRQLFVVFQQTESGQNKWSDDSVDIETPLLAGSVRPKQNKLNKGASNMIKSPAILIGGNLGDVWFFVLMLHLNLIFSYIFCVFSYIHNLNCYQTVNC